MYDMIYRNNSIAEENIDLGYKDEKVKSAQKRKKLIKEMDKVIKEDLK